LGLSEKRKRGLSHTTPLLRVSEVQRAASGEQRRSSRCKTWGALSGIPGFSKTDDEETYSKDRGRLTFWKAKKEMVTRDCGTGCARSRIKGIKHTQLVGKAQLLDVPA